MLPLLVFHDQLCTSEHLTACYNVLYSVIDEHTSSYYITAHLHVDVGMRLIKPLTLYVHALINLMLNSNVFDILCVREELHME